MKNLLKVSCLVVALLATVAMVGCGGGGGGGGNPAAPVNTTSNEALAAKAAVTPVLQNAKAILSGNANVASFRASTTKVEEFNTNEIGDSVINAIQAPQLLRAVISAAGGNIEDGLWENESTFSSFCEVATYSNGVYERTVYYDNPDDITKNGKNSSYMGEADDIVAYYKIEGCSADYNAKDKIIRSLTINKGAKITVDEKRGFYFHGPDRIPSPTSFKGTINTDLNVQWEGNIETFKSPKVFELTFGNKYYSTSGKDITDSYKNYNEGLQASKRITSKTTYTFSKLELDLSEFQMVDNPIYNYNQEFKGNIKINIAGITGNIVAKKTAYVDCRYINSNNNGWNWNNEKQAYYSNDAYSYDEETGEEIVDTSKPYYSYANAVIVEKPIINLKYGSPVTIALSGNISNFIFGMNGWHHEIEAIDYNDKKEKFSGNLKDLTITINKMSGNYDALVIDDAKIHIETGDYKTDKALMIGNREIIFNKAKIDITGLKYNYKLYEDFKSDSSYGTYDQYKAKSIEIRNHCFGNAIVKLEAEETKNSVTIKADCDINKKTANLNLVNNGDLIVKEDTLQFNFNTVEIKATNADILADNKCEGAILKVTGVEKDGTKSERTYNVVKGKLVLDTKSQKDKQAPANLPEVKIADIPDELSNSNSIEVAVSEAKPSEEIMKDPANESLKIGKKGDLKVASYNKKKTNNSKKIETNVSAKNKLIAAVSFYGDNDYTLVFVIDYSDEKHPQIKGSIFKGKVNNKTMDSPDRIAQFAGKDGKITVISPNGTSEVAVQ